MIPISWINRKTGKAKFNISELRAKYLFTLIYCFIEKILLKKEEKFNYVTTKISYNLFLIVFLILLVLTFFIIIKNKKAKTIQETIYK